MCQRGTVVPLFMNDPWGGRFWNIDQCIASLVQVLLELGVELNQVCCGHRKKPITITFFPGRENSGYHTVLKLKPDTISPLNSPSTISAQWNDIPYDAMDALGGHYHGDGTITDRPVTTMFISQGGHATWWHDMPTHAYSLVQMLRAVGIHTINSSKPPSPEGICVWFVRGVDNTAYDTVLRLKPDCITPREHDGIYAATWYTSPIPKLLVQQGEIHGFS